MTSKSSKIDDDQLSETEAKRRSEAALKRMLNTPPTPHAKKRRPSRQRSASGKAKKAR